MKLELFTGAFFAAVAAGVLASDQDPSRNLDLRLAGAAAPVRLVPVQAAEPPGGMRTCASKADILNYLETRYGEVPVAVWRNSPRAMMTLLGRPDGATWSLLLSDPGGVTCLVSSGLVWRPLLRRAEEEGPGA